MVSEYYINDAGRQMKLLGFLSWPGIWNRAGRRFPFPEDGYQGDYIREVAAQVKDEQGERTAVASRRRCGTAKQGIRLSRVAGADPHGDLERFGITFESWFSEASLLSSGAVEQGTG